jgi:hypothetical protein
MASISANSQSLSPSPDRHCSGRWAIPCPSLVRIANPVPVPIRSLQNGSADRSQRIPARCDLLHRRFGRPCPNTAVSAVNRGNCRANEPTIVRSTPRDPDRLRLDRHWRRGRGVRADLSSFGLNPPPRRPAAMNSSSAGPAKRFIRRLVRPRGPCAAANPSSSRARFTPPIV